MLKFFLGLKYPQINFKMLNNKFSSINKKGSQKAASA